jgi:hypothetical protein
MVLSKYVPAGSNRSLRACEVRVLAETMRAGRWDSRTHQGAAFDLDGNLTDGQHRFHACVMSGVSFRLPATFGQPRAVFPAVDQNAPRRVADLVFVARLEVTRPIEVAAVARTLLVLRRRGGSGQRIMIDKRTVLAFIAGNVDELNVVVRPQPSATCAEAGTAPVASGGRGDGGVPARVRAGQPDAVSGGDRAAVRDQPGPGRRSLAWGSLT